MQTATAKGMKEITIGGSVYFYDIDYERLTCKCNKVNNRMKNKSVGKCLFYYRFNSIDRINEYIKEHQEKMQSLENRKAEVRAERRFKAKTVVYLTKSWCAVYNGFKVRGSRKLEIKGSWGIHKDGVLRFYAHSYGDSIPQEIREIQGVTVENNTDSMTDYFDTDTLYVKQSENPLLYNILKNAFI